MQQPGHAAHSGIHPVSPKVRRIQEAVRPGVSRASLSRPHTRRWPWLAAAQPLTVGRLVCRTIEPTAFRKFYERGDLPIAIHHAGLGNKLKWKVRFWESGLVGRCLLLLLCQHLGFCRLDTGELRGGLQRRGLCATTTLPELAVMHFGKPP